MKLIRFLTALAFASTLAVSFVHAEEKAKDDKACEKTCDCGKDKDGKTCGVDKDCCCTGKKAEKKAEAASEAPAAKK